MAQWNNLKARYTRQRKQAKSPGQSGCSTKEAQKAKGSLEIYHMLSWLDQFVSSRVRQVNSSKKAKFQELLNSNELDGEDEYIDVQESESSDTDEQCHSPSEVDINSFNDKEEECPEELQDNSLENASCLPLSMEKRLFLSMHL